MRFFRSSRRSAAKAPVSSTRQQRTAWQNLFLCVLGLAISFLYLLQNNSMGWLFLLSFGFFLIMQATPRNEDE